MDSREILDFGTWFEVWSADGACLFTASSRAECEDWLNDNSEDDEECYDVNPDW
jgi:hypothetical protein